MTEIAKTRAVGYIHVTALSHLPEWQDYSAAAGLKARRIAKDRIRDLIRKAVQLPEGARIDFIKLPDDRLQVWEDLSPKKDRKKGTDLSSLFGTQPPPKPRPKL